MKFSCILPLLLSSVVSAIWLDTNNRTTIVEDTALIAKGLLDYYEGYQYGGTIGMFTAPYYWWEAGGAWGSLIDYTFYLQNDTLVPLIKEALLYQTGDDDNYIPLNQSTTEGNDDQGFWGIAVMAAAERNFSNPDESTGKSWLALTQAVFNTMTARWDMDSCNGGLRWQIFQWNSGYDYKNSVSNGCLFQIAARLARYTGNTSYSDWAEKVWDWMEDMELIVDKGGYWTNHGGLLTAGEPYYAVYDGAYVDGNCSNVTQYQWTYNIGLMLAGSAYLYNFTEDEKWYNRTAALLRGSSVFFINNSIMYEAACQGAGNCNNDQRSFKAYFARFLALTSILVTDTRPTIYQWLVDSANAAAQLCLGGTDGHTCGLNWNATGWDGYYGLGEQMSALEVMQNLLVADLPAPYTAQTGGSLQGDPAGGYATTVTDQSPLDLDAGDKAGAAIITAVIGISLVGSAVWLLI